MTSLSEILNSIKGNELPAALCIVVSTKGSVPRKEGAKMLVLKNGNIKGSIGGGNLEKQVIKDALRVIENKEPQLFRHDLLHQHEMCCGGTVQIYIEPIMQKNRLYIFGSGHTGKALASLASGLEFETVVIDDRKEYLDELNNTAVNKMHLPFNDALKILPFNDQTYVAILTYSHPVDRDILFHCLKKPYAYLGMIGSRRKVELTKKMLRETNFADGQTIENIDMPMGIAINAESPEEIALSIMAKIIKVKNGLRQPSVKERGTAPAGLKISVND
jgi:xanthine dehydrogenase accessory factor